MHGIRTFYGGHLNVRLNKSLLFYKKGMSFVEMLVVLTIMVIVSVGIYGMLNSGITIWQRTFEINFEEDVRIFFDRLRADLSKYVPFDSMNFEANKTSLGFSIIESLPYNAPWAGKKNEMPINQIAYVKYIYKGAYDRVEKHVSNMFNKKVNEKIVFRNVRKFDISYFVKDKKGKIVEVDKLAGKQKPQMVKVEFQYGDKLSPKEAVEIIELPFML